MDRYRRLRAIACRYWGCTPGEFDDQAAAGRIALSDVIDLVRIVTCNPFEAPGLAQFLAPDAVERREQNQRQQGWNRQFALLAHLAGVGPGDLVNTAGETADNGA